jgi:hypothetical protein
MTDRILALAVTAALLGSAPAAAEVVEQTDSGFTTRDTVVVKGTPYEVWLALISPAKWWSKGHTWSGDAQNLYISAQANGCFCELLPAPEGAPEEIRRGSAQHMTVVMADPGKVLRMRGGLGPLQSEPAEGVLTVTLGKVDGGTKIVWEYVVGGPMRYEIPVISKAVDGVMSQQLRGLASVLGPVASAKPEAEEEPSPAKDAAAPKPAAKPEVASKPKVEDAFEDLTGEE